MKKKVPRLTIGKRVTYEEAHNHEIYCYRCGSKLLEDKTCPECGILYLSISSPSDPPDRKCAGCGDRQYFLNRYCTECGAKLPIGI